MFWVHRQKHNDATAPISPEERWGQSEIPRIELVLAVQRLLKCIRMNENADHFIFRGRSGELIVNVLSTISTLETASMLSTALLAGISVTGSMFESSPRERTMPCSCVTCLFARQEKS